MNYFLTSISILTYTHNVTKNKTGAVERVRLDNTLYLTPLIFVDLQKDFSNTVLSLLTEL